MKCSFFQAAVVSILLYGCTTWTLTKRLEKKLDGNYTRMLRAILNKSWWQHPTRPQLYGHLPPITKTIQVRRARHAEHCWRNKDELVSDVLLWTPTYGQAKAGQPARTYILLLRRTRHAGHCWRSKDKLISDVLLWIPAYGQAKAGRPARIYIQQLCEDTGCNPEDLPEAMNDREKWREMVKDIHAGGTTWWWWWWYIYILIDKTSHFIIVSLLKVFMYWLGLKEGTVSNLSLVSNAKFCNEQYPLLNKFNS